MHKEADLHQTARQVVLARRLSRRERRMAFAQRMYANELPDAALQAYADWLEQKISVQRTTKSEEFAPIPATVLGSN